MWHLFALVICAACLPTAFLQVVPVDLPREICKVDPTDLNVFPSAGFYRDPLKPFQSTTTVGGSRNGAPAPAPVASISDIAGCTFLSFDPKFDRLIGGNRTIYQVGPSKGGQWATESPAYLPDTNEVIFASWFQVTPSTISKVNLATGEPTTVPVSPPVGNAGGAIQYGDQVAFCTVGEQYSDANPPGVYLVDPQAGNSSVLFNNFFGIRFNGFDDIQTLKDGSIIVTDSNYTGKPQFGPPFKNSAKFPDMVWIYQPGQVARVLVDDVPMSPNGLTVSPDEKTLLVTMGPLNGMDPYGLSSVNKLYAYDLVREGGQVIAQNKRVLSSSDNSYYDSIETDTEGNIFVASGNGVTVLSPEGKTLGKIVVPNANAIAGQTTPSVGLAGKNLIMMHIAEVYMLPLNTSGVEHYGSTSS